MANVNVINRTVTISNSSKISWKMVQNFYNMIPMDMTPCKSVYDAKMYTTILLIASCAILPFLAPVLCYVLLSAKKHKLTQNESVQER